MNLATRPQPTFGHHVYNFARRIGLVRPLIAMGGRIMDSKRRMRRLFAGWTPGSSDVIVATFMKSGTNWMMQATLQIAHRGAAEFDHIHDIVPWPDAPQPEPVPLTDPGPAASAPTGLRIIKTHGSADVVPLSPDAKYVVVLRDPKEVIVSAYHFALPLLGLTAQVDAARWLRMFGTRGIDWWVRHTAGWWALRDEPNVRVVRFADMKADLPGTIDDLAEFMGVELTAAERARIIERSGFRWMKAHNAQFAPLRMPFFDPDAMPEMVRRGASGGATELYTPEQLAQVDAQVLRSISKRRVELPYRDLFNCTI